jgi:hypothetical protein
MQRSAKSLPGQQQMAGVLGGCPRIEVVARGSGFEAIFSIKRGEYWAYLTSLIGKMGQNPLFRSRLSILGQPPRRTANGPEPNTKSYTRRNPTSGLPTAHGSTTREGTAHHFARNEIGQPTAARRGGAGDGAAQSYLMYLNRGSSGVPSRAPSSLPGCHMITSSIFRASSKSLLVIPLAA